MKEFKRWLFAVSKFTALIAAVLVVMIIPISIIMLLYTILGPFIGFIASIFVLGIMLGTGMYIIERKNYE